MSDLGRKARQPFEYKTLSLQVPVELWKKFEYVARKYKYKDPIPVLKDIIIENVEKWTGWGYFKDMELDEAALKKEKEYLIAKAKREKKKKS